MPDTPETASELSPPRVRGDMNEIEAGEAIASYIEQAAGGSDRDLDVFDGSTEDPADSASRGASEVESEETEEETEETAAEAESAESSEDEDQQDDTTQEDADAEALQLEVADLASVLGVSEEALLVDDDGHLKLRTQVNGEAGEATLGDVLKSYQLQGAVNQKSEQLSEERRKLHAEIQQREQALHGALEQAQAFEAAVTARVMDKYSRVDWDALMQTDPGRAAVLKLERQDELNTIQSEAATVRNQIQGEMHKVNERQAEQYRAWETEQVRLMHQHLPELADPEKAPDKLRGFQEYLYRVGYAPEEVQMIRDHRLLRVVDDAVRYRASQREGAKRSVPAEVVRKKLRRVPRISRGGAPKDDKERRVNRRVSAAKALRRSGSDDDAARFAIESGVVDDML